MEAIENVYGFERPFQEDPLVVRGLLHHETGNLVLDVGCGEGADSVYFARKGFKVLAIDSNKVYLDRLRTYLGDHPALDITLSNFNVINHRYAELAFDIVVCLLVGCCMRKSEFEHMVQSLKRTIKPAGLMIMSLRNYLDPQFEEYLATEEMIEPNTYRKKEDCCEIRYYIERARLKEVFGDFEIEYYFEGLVPDKYGEIPEHGDSLIIARKKTTDGKPIPAIG